jgi:IS5 family transposase
LAMATTIPGRRRATLGGDRGYDTQDFVARCRRLGMTPHVAQNNTNRRSAVDARTTRHPGYAVSQRVRKRVEEVFGWMKTIGLLRKVRHRGQFRVGWQFLLTAAVYNLIRLRTLASVVT